MGESQKPKRRFWQIHLSTVMLLAICAGGFMSLNFHRWKTEDYVQEGISVIGHNQYVEMKMKREVYGWPFPVRRLLAKEFEQEFSSSPVFDSSGSENMLYNLASCCLMLIGNWVSD